MLKGTIRHTIGASALTAMLLLLCVSCSDDAISTASIGGGDGDSVMIGITLQASYGYDDDYYETGSDYENYIDVAGGDYRIYFFTNEVVGGNDTFIAKFTPESVLPVEGSNYTQYDVQGVVPEALLQYTTFKVVMLANWGNNYEDADFGSSTTIDDICSVKAEWATYDHKENFELSPSNLIPFYGVNTYSNVEFKKGEFTKLDGDLTLLRAMAKVEVTFDSDLLTAEPGTVFTDVRVVRYNDKGYCAPDKAYTKDSYDHNYNGQDFMEDIHLVGTKYTGETAEIQYDGFNDYDEDGNPIERSLTFKSNIEGTTWYAYLPEYDNNSYNTDDYAYIEVKFTYRNYEEGPYRIYFADYNEDTGTTDNSVIANRFDIKRNNLYRFTIVDLVQYFRVHVNKWTEEWNNDFYYDSSEDL